MIDTSKLKAECSVAVRLDEYDIKAFKSGFNMEIKPEQITEILSAPEPKKFGPFWANVYETSRKQLPMKVYSYPSRELADANSMPARIACIEIPEFCEGEGIK